MAEQIGKTRIGRPRKRKRPQTVKRRSKTIPQRKLTQEEKKIRDELDASFSWNLPINRVECKEGRRPCPFVSCKHHLYLDVNPETGSLKLNFPHLEVWEMEESCALDIAENGGITLEDVGVIMNLTRERVRQLERDALLKVTESGDLDKFNPLTDDF